MSKAQDLLNLLPNPDLVTEEQYPSFREQLMEVFPLPEFYTTNPDAKDDSSLFLAKSRYLEFLRQTVRYENNPDHFPTAFNWVDNHPAFWFRHTAATNQWITDSNGHVWTGVSTDSKGNTVVMLEHGAAVEPSRTTHYHDLRLDVYAPTYEQAFIQLAAKIHKFFDVDGSERPNIDYDRSELEIVLEDRIAVLKQQGIL